jgi:hypothetical protein
MPRRKKVSTAITPANEKANPPAPTLPDQKRDQIASLKVSEGGDRRLSIDAPTPGSLSRLMTIFGTKDRDFFDGLAKQIARVASRESASETAGFLFSVVKNTRPRDELEAMLVTQMAACHLIAMDMTARLYHWDDHRLFPKIMKTFADLKEAFDRGRKGTEHSAIVQNMTVKDGGQAIVGNVTQRSTESSQGKTTTSAPPSPEARAVPVARIDESPKLAPYSPVAERGEETHAFGDKDDH